MIKLTLRYVMVGIYNDSPWSLKNRKIGNEETVHFSSSKDSWCPCSYKFVQSGSRFKRLKINANFITSKNYSVHHILKSYEPWEHQHSKIPAYKMINVMFNIVGIDGHNEYDVFQKYKQHCTRILENYRWVGGEQKKGKTILKTLEQYKTKKLNDAELFVLETFINLTKKTFGV